MKVDYPYYVFSILKVLIFSKSYENTAPAMLLEHPHKPVLAMNGKRVSFAPLNAHPEAS